MHQIVQIGQICGFLLPFLFPLEAFSLTVLILPVSLKKHLENSKLFWCVV